jgi:hypothetical protein
MDERFQANYDVNYFVSIYKMALPKFNKFSHYIYPLTVTLILSFIYNKYKSSEDEDEHMQNYKIVKQYLLVLNQLLYYFMILLELFNVIIIV